MEKLESIAFLALCVGVPVAMGAILFFRLVRWIRDRGATARVARDAGWHDVAPAVVEDALAESGIRLGRGVSIHEARRREDLIVAVHQWRWRGGSRELRQGSTRRLLIVPRDADGPLGVVEARQGGVLEAAALGVASSAGAAPRELPGWEWAMVSAPGDWLGEAASARVRELLQPGERLHLGRTHAVLSMPNGEMAPVLEGAGARAEAMRSAVS